MDGYETDSRSAIVVVVVPAVTMLIGSIALLCTRLSAVLQARTQMFSAGLLISAVAGELFPLMSRSEAESFSTVGICMGFGVGLLFMFGLEHLTEGGEAEEAAGVEGQMDKQTTMGRQRSRSSTSALEAALLSEDEVNQNLEAFRCDIGEMAGDLAKLETGLQQACREDIDQLIHMLMYRADKARRRLRPTGPLDEANLARMSFHVGELRANVEKLSEVTDVASARLGMDVVEGTLNHIHGHAHRTKFRRWKPSPKPPEEKPLSERVPWPLVLAVTVDSGVDGLLIGLAFTASASAGWCMSIATSIEMGFLGLSFSASVQNATRSAVKHAVLVALPPLVLLLAGVSGHQLGTLLEETPGLFISFIAFSIVALLFLVTQELLTEAHEVAGEDVVTNIMFFVGLLGGILLEKYLG